MNWSAVLAVVTRLVGNELCNGRRDNTEPEAIRELAHWYSYAHDIQTIIGRTPLLLISVIVSGRGKAIALDVARGLLYLHDNHIVHLDIKVCCPLSLPEIG